MPKIALPYATLSYFSTLLRDYLKAHSNLQDFYGRYPSLANFEAQLLEKKKQYPIAHRVVLGAALADQYRLLDTTLTTQKNLELLQKETTFTITTGHQLNLFTGPFYFLYKIISTINVTEALKKKYPRYDFVPIYWMATEDHDFEEINYFNLFGQKIQWNRDAAGAVGDLDTKGLDKVVIVLQELLGKGSNAKDLLALFEAAYLHHDTLAAATRYLANALFGRYGLVVVDGNTRAQKELLVPYIKEELTTQVAYHGVMPVAKALEALDYKIQVHPRAINLFYLKAGLRARIVRAGDRYLVHNTSISWNQQALLEEVDQFPERFSPNVIMRPLYQEVLLPNLCYIAGGGELAYWLELKAYFEAVKVPFPILLLRNSVVLLTKKQGDKLQKLEVKPEELFLKQHELIHHKVRQISNIPIDFEPQKKQLKEQFAALYETAELTDKSFLNAVKAQEVKQIKGLEHLEKRLLKAQKIKYHDQVQRLTSLQNELFPNQNLQERVLNFSELYLEYGAALIPFLKKHLDPLDGEFLVLEVALI